MQAAVPGRIHHANPQALRHAWQTLIQERRLPIMAIVGNRGCIQIYSGRVHNIRILDAWLNVMDTGFNLHIDQNLFAQCWLVRKPTTEGVVTSIDVFDAHGELIVQFFGERHPAQPESPAWRELAESLTEPLLSGEALRAQMA